jgi:hypothetical protein
MLRTVIVIWEDGDYNLGRHRRISQDERYRDRVMSGIIPHCRHAGMKS